MDTKLIIVLVVLIIIFALVILAIWLVRIFQQPELKPGKYYYAVEYMSKTGSIYTVWDICAATPEEAMKHVRNWYGIDHIREVSLRMDESDGQTEYRVIWTKE